MNKQMGNLEEILNMIGRIEGKTLEAELNEARKSYSKSELNEAMIVEKQHVAGFKYNDVIDEIIWYIRNYISSNRYSRRKGTLGIKGGWWKFQIPKEITSKFDFIENFVIEVDIEDFRFKKGESFGNGVTYTSSEDKLVNGVMDNGYIIIRGISFNSILNDYSIRNNLYHELTHAYEAYKRELNLKKVGGKYWKHALKWNELEMKIRATGDDELTSNFAFIVYRLFNKSELSAAASSTYAYLKSIKGKRSELLKDIKKTQGYYEYETIKKHMQDLKLQTDMDWWDAKRLVMWGTTKATAQDFKNWFIGKTGGYLKDYFHSMMSAAASYYDETEAQEPISPYVISR